MARHITSPRIPGTSLRTQLPPWASRATVTTAARQAHTSPPSQIQNRRRSPAPNSAARSRPPSASSRTVSRRACVFVPSPRSGSSEQVRDPQLPQLSSPRSWQQDAMGHGPWGGTPFVALQPAQPYSSRISHTAQSLPQNPCSISSPPLHRRAHIQRIPCGLYRLLGAFRQRHWAAVLSDLPQPDQAAGSVCPDCITLSGGRQFLLCGPPRPRVSGSAPSLPFGPGCGTLDPRPFCTAF